MPTHRPKDSGWIEVICGSMFSGKTEELMRRLRRAKIAGQKVVTFKPKVDSRYGEGHIVSHSRLKMKSQSVDHPREILDLAADADVVAVDEAQFFQDDLVNVCTALASREKRVIVAGLDKDFRGIPFGPMPYLLSQAEYVTKFLAICMQCGNPASFTQRLTGDADQIVIGTSDIYEARCRRCYEPPPE